MAIIFIIINKYYTLTRGPVWLQHRPVSDHKPVDRTVVVWPSFQVQPQVRRVGLQEQRFLRYPGPATFRLGCHHDAGRGATHLVVGHDVRLIGLAARQVLRTNIHQFYRTCYPYADSLSSPKIHPRNVQRNFKEIRILIAGTKHTHVQIVRRCMSRDRHLSVRAPRVQVVRHGVAGDRSIAVGRQPPVEHESGAGGTSRVQDGWLRGHCKIV